MKLTFEHIAPYLPHGLKILHAGKQKKMNAAQGSSVNWIGISSVIRWNDSVAEKPMPLVRPLSDLTSEIEVNGERFVPIDKIKTRYNAINSQELKTLDFYRTPEDGFCIFGTYEDEEEWVEIGMPFWVYQEVLRCHVDIFNLIESGLAVDINQIEK